jgi:hypothetical protein
VRATSPTLVTPVLGTPTSGTLTNATGLPLTTGVTGTLPVANGGTGAATLTANNVLLGNATSALQVVAPGASGNLLTSNGTTWASAVPATAPKLLATLTASASASLSDTTSLTSSYKSYLFKIINVVPSVAFGDLQLQVSTDGGGSWKTDAAYQCSTLEVHDATPDGQSLTGQTKIDLNYFGPSTTASHLGINMELRLGNPSATGYKHFIGHGSEWNGTNLGVLVVAATYTGSTAAINAIKFFCASGNIASGTIEIWGYA